MRRISLALAVALAAQTAQGSVAGTEPAGDSGFGAGHVLQTDFVASGHSGPNGESPVGTITLRGYLDFTATATCANVAGNAVVAGYRIETGRRAGKGFISSAVDRGLPRKGRPVDLTVYSGILPRPPLNCPSPGDPPPPRMSSTGGGPFTRGDFTLVDARERLPGGAPRARVTALRATGWHAGLTLRVRLCGAPGMALLRFSLASSPFEHNRPVGERASWGDELRQTASCSVHRIRRPLGGSPGGRRYRVTVRARTTGQRWSTRVVRLADVR
jgi:hypothetical protein